MNTLFALSFHNQSCLPHLHVFKQVVVFCIVFNWFFFKLNFRLHLCIYIKEVFEILFFFYLILKYMFFPGGGGGNFSKNLVCAKLKIIFILFHCNRIDNIDWNENLLHSTPRDVLHDVFSNAIYPNYTHKKSL